MWRPVQLSILVVLVVVARPCAAQLWSAGPDGVRQSEDWVLAEGVADPLFSAMIGVVDSDFFGGIRQAQIDSIITANGGSKLPYEVFAEIRRVPVPGAAAALVQFLLFDEVDRPIPYSLLGYNPGSIRASQRLDFLEFDIGRRRYLVKIGDDDEVEVQIENAHLLVLVDGYMEMDFDGWLDRMLGSKLDDMRVKAFLIFTTPEGQRYSLGMGQTKKGRGKTGAFDFLEDSTVFPAPKELLVVGREMRTEGLRRLEQWNKLHGPSAAPGDGAASPGS
jgi:hypothetical protein